MSRTGKRRLFRSKEFWRAEIDKFRLSGQSISDYCREHHLATSTFARKLKILGSDLDVPAQTAKHPPSFIEVRTHALSLLRINLPSGISIDVPEACDLVQLDKVIALCRR